MLRPLVKYWRQQGIRVVVYLDDGLVAAKGIESAQRVSRTVREDLAKAGFVENAGKCEREPLQQLS